MTMHSRIVEASTGNINFFDDHFDLGYDWYLRQMPMVWDQQVLVFKIREITKKKQYKTWQ